MLNQKEILFFALTGVLFGICSCGDQVPDRPPASPPASSTSGPTPRAAAAAAKSQQAVLVHLKLTDGKFGTESEARQIATLEAELEHAITAANTGEYDGNEIGGGEYMLYAYGPDARRLAEVMRPILLKTTTAPGSYLIIRSGPAGAPEVRQQLAGSAPTAAPGSPAPAPPPTRAPGNTGGAQPTAGSDVVIPKGFDVSLVDILACPETKTPVRLASRRELDEINSKLLEGNLRMRDGTTRSKPVEALLVRQDGKIGYEIENGVPVMLIDRAIVLQPGASPPRPARTR